MLSGAMPLIGSNGALQKSTTSLAVRKRTEPGSGISAKCDAEVTKFDFAGRGGGPLPKAFPAQAKLQAVLQDKSSELEKRFVLVASCTPRTNVLNLRSVSSQSAALQDKSSEL